MEKIQTFRAPASLPENFDPNTNAYHEKVATPKSPNYCACHEKINTPKITQMARVPSKVDSPTSPKCWSCPQKKMSSFFLSWLFTFTAFFSWLACSVSQLQHSFPETYPLLSISFYWTFPWTETIPFWTVSFTELCLWWSIPLLMKLVPFLNSTVYFLYWTTPLFLLF